MKWLILFILTVVSAFVYVRYFSSSKEQPSQASTANPPVLDPEGDQSAQPSLPPGGGIRPTPNPLANPQTPPSPQNHNFNANPNGLALPPQAPPSNFNGFQNGLPDEINPEPPFEPPPPPPQYFPENEGFNSVPPAEVPSPFEPPPIPDNGENNNGFVPPPPPPPQEEGDF